MNVLEHYIDKIISEEKVKNPGNDNEYYRVNAIVDCYGAKEQINRLFIIDEWEKAKKRGYYMG